jgi:hypothetical protein
VFHDISRPFEAEASSCGCHQMAGYSTQKNIDQNSVKSGLDSVFIRSNVMCLVIFSDKEDI